MSKLIALVLCVAVCLGLLTGCAQQNAGGGNDAPANVGKTDDGNSGESNPFFFVTPETTEEDFIRQFGEPDERDRSQMIYKNIEAFGFTGTLWVAFYDYDMEMVLSCAYPGVYAWIEDMRAEYDEMGLSDEFPDVDEIDVCSLHVYEPTDSDIREGRAMWAAVYETISEHYGDPEDKNSGDPNACWDITEYNIGIAEEENYISIQEGDGAEAFEVHMNIQRRG